MIQRRPNDRQDFLRPSPQNVSRRETKNPPTIQRQHVLTLPVVAEPSEGLSVMCPSVNFDGQFFLGECDVDPEPSPGDRRKFLDDPRSINFLHPSEKDLLGLRRSPAILRLSRGSPGDVRGKSDPDSASFFRGQAQQERLLRNIRPMPSWRLFPFRESC